MRSSAASRTSRDNEGAHEVEGAAAPLTLYRIVRASGGRRGGARALTPFVGREDELDLLRRGWERSLKGEGQLTLVVGEPGIGKSRLVEEFRAWLGEKPHTFVEWSSSQLLQNTPLHPIAEWGRLRFGGADMPAEKRLADLENTVELIGLDAGEYAPLIAPIVNIPLPEDRAVSLPPEELRRRQMAALVAWALAGAHQQPVALAFDNRMPYLAVQRFRVCKRRRPKLASSGNKPGERFWRRCSIGRSRPSSKGSASLSKVKSGVAICWR